MSVLVYTENWESSLGGMFYKTIDITEFQDGYYILSIESETNRYSKRIIKNRF